MLKTYTIFARVETGSFFTIGAEKLVTKMLGVESE